MNLWKLEKYGVSYKYVKRFFIQSKFVNSYVYYDR